MKGRTLARLAAVTCALCLAVGVMSSRVIARAEEAPPEPEATPQAIFVILDLAAEETTAPIAEPMDNRTTVPLVADGQERGVCAVLDGRLYVAPGVFARAAAPEAELPIEVSEGDLYFVCNGRYLFVEGGVPAWNGEAVLPVDLLAKCYGVSAAWDRSAWTVTLRADDAEPLESGDAYYDENDVYWLSRVIYAEAGNQSLLGQIAVGSVVMNRLADESFSGQNSVYDVIFAKNQFEVVINGMIYMEPDDQAQIAAKLALEGADVVSGATYFATYFFGEGYDCVTWIGDHCFMSESA